MGHPKLAPNISGVGVFHQLHCLVGEVPSLNLFYSSLEDSSLILRVLFPVSLLLSVSQEIHFGARQLSFSLSYTRA